MPSRIRRLRAYQLVDDPESAVTIASCREALGQLRDDQHRVDRLGRHMGLRGPWRPATRPTFFSMVSRPRPLSGSGRSHRQQRVQRGGGVADQVDLDGVAHPDEPAVDVDLHRPGLPVLRQELAVREVRPHDEQGVAVAHHLVAGPGAEQPDGAGDIGQVVGQHVLAQQRLGHPRAGEVGQPPDLLGARRARPARPGRRAAPPR